MSLTKKTMDGNEAAAYISYAFTEVATIYPITPSSPMAELVDQWSAKGKKNLFNQRVKLVEMQSEAGAAGAMHGSLETGALTTTYTASQGLMLMHPVLYRLSGQLKPGVVHVSSRTIGTHAMSIFGDHSDVMACRQTGLAMLSESSVQEVMDLSAVAHLAAIEGHVPFMNFFDGFRTSHEIQKIDVIDYEDLRPMLNEEELEKFRKNSLNPERPVQRSTVQNPDIHFQAKEVSNPYYDRLPEIVEKYMGKINRLTGRNYQLFNYYGAEDADRIVILMGSASGVVEEVVDHLNSQGEKVGYLKVHLYRPFSVEHFLKAIPETVKKISVMDRTKEPGSHGEPLYLDVCAAFANEDRKVEIYGGRYGLSSKDVLPNQIIAVFENMKIQNPKKRFTIGIHDDVTHLSLPLGENIDLTKDSTKSCKFWGLGSDGTVGANKNSIKIIGNHTDQYVQAYFEYDTKKSGGLTRSHLRFGSDPIIGSYLVNHGDFVACHNQSYIFKYDMVDELKQGGTFLLNTIWTGEELEEKLPNRTKRIMAEKEIEFYTINATRLAADIGMGNRTNTILQAAFFKLIEILPIEEAVQYMKDAITKTYGAKGDDILEMNYKAVDIGVEKLVREKVKEEWKNLEDEIVEIPDNIPDYVRNIQIPANQLKGDQLPVSAFIGQEDGSVPFGTTKYEKRGVATQVPHWIAENCIQCNQCSYVCPHAVIRPFLFTEEETAQAPEDMEFLDARGRGIDQYKFKIQVSVMDCLGCGSCANVCPAKNKALVMKSLEEELDEIKKWDFAIGTEHKETPLNPFTVKGSQFNEPLLEFSGACAGCGETPYMKILTQIFGDRMIVANATGCTQAWGGCSPSVPYTTNCHGNGPAWSNSLFENNAEYALGMELGVVQQRERLKEKLMELSDKTGDKNLKEAIAHWLEGYHSSEDTIETSRALKQAIYQTKESEETKELLNDVKFNGEHLTKKSIWMYGGDGWAYDIGYGGLDHVLSTGADVNIMLVDTEVYSNTGGQSSKATPLGAVAAFASAGKRTAKKDLGKLMMTYGHIYVAQVAQGANQNQLLKAIKEAESYPGPSLIIAYAPCINHGIKSGMGWSQMEQKKAVESGYWFLYRYDPRRRMEGKNPFVLDSKEPTESFEEFLMGEVRYSSLLRTFPEIGEQLIAEATEQARQKYEEYKKMAEMDIF
ncbi:MAG: pyruvate:ferredoxin (flavodoxin) oxidoreductase [Tissierellia bacterium]|nr:pyruvate:ferredoxin (flavodoxin) oxidoreductase [Tissierellia bacterium]